MLERGELKRKRVSMRRESVREKERENERETERERERERERHDYERTRNKS